MERKQPSEIVGYQRFVYHGRPTSWQRPRPAKYGKRMYNPHQKEQDDLGTFFKSQGAKRFYGPLTLCLDFWIKVGKASDNYNVVGIKDLSNMVKLVEDAGNEILWFDDRQIVELRANKHYAGEGQEERTEIVVIALDSVPVGKIAGFWEH